MRWIHFFLYRALDIHTISALFSGPPPTKGPDAISLIVEFLRDSRRNDKIHSRQIRKLTSWTKKSIAKLRAGKRCAHTLQKWTLALQIPYSALWTNWWSLLYWPWDSCDWVRLKSSTVYCVISAQGAFEIELWTRHFTPQISAPFKYSIRYFITLSHFCLCYAPGNISKVFLRVLLLIFAWMKQKGSPWKRGGGAY